MLSLFMCFYQKLVLVAEYYVDCWQTLQWRLLWRIFSSTNDHKSKQVKEQWHEKFYLQSVWGKTRYFKHRKYQNLSMNNKIRGNKNAICFHFLPYPLIICRQHEFFISQDSVATCIRWGGQFCIGLVANFVRFPAVQTFWKSVKIS